MKKYYCADFETTVYDGQESTEVWAAALTELFDTSDFVEITQSIEEFWWSLVKKYENMVVYFHNVKFDGSFLLDFFLRKMKFKQAYELLDETTGAVKWKEDKDMRSKEFKYAISNMGQWYNIKVKIGKRIIEFRDSLKLLPFSVKDIGKSFKTKHQKLEMEYKGFRYAGCPISKKEREYIRNDVLVMKEAMELMFTEGHDKMTIGACCLAEYKKTMVVADFGYNTLFPDLYEMETPEGIGSASVGQYIRRSYRGGWCYVVPGKANKVLNKGLTVDVNSLYPSVMHSDSGSKYPVGNPYFYKGSPPKKAKDNYYFIRFKCKFRIKKGYLPFVQIKGNPFYKSNENLESSDFYWKKTGKYYDKGYIDGKLVDSHVTLTMTCTEYKLFRKHYNVEDFEYLDGYWFYTMTGIFDEYINKYKKIKMESKGAKRTLAKLFLNNLYGKLAASPDSSFKVAELIDGRIVYREVEAHDKTPGYIAIGSAITSYARAFTIIAAQKNYYGPNNRGFCYADTDSLHCDLSVKELKGIKLHDSEFNHWALECQWDTAIFVRQKTYMEHVTHEGLEEIEAHYDIKCAGMPKRSKEYFIASMLQNTPVKELLAMPKHIATYIGERRTIHDFKVGLKVPGKLLPKRITGGVVLLEVPYEMR